MTRQGLLEELEDILEREAPCKEDDLLEDYEEWDSLSKMAVMAFFEINFSVNLNLSDLSSLKTVSDLLDLAGGNLV